MTNPKRKRTKAALDGDGDGDGDGRKRKRTKAALDGDGDGGLKSKPVSRKSRTMGRKKLKQTGDKNLAVSQKSRTMGGKKLKETGDKNSAVSRKSRTMGRKKLKETGDESASVLGDNRIEDVRWLCSLSESELDLLICLKTMVLRRAEKIHPSFADKIDLKVLRDLSFSMMKNLKDELKKDNLSRSCESAESSEQIAESNLSQVDVEEKFSSMTNEELWPFIYPDYGRKILLDI